MSAVLATIDWGTVISVVWTVVLVPIFVYIKNRINEIAKIHKVEKYTKLLEKSIENVVKDIQSSVVSKIKGTEEWTPELIQEVKDMAWRKAVESMTYEGYSLLSKMNPDFDDYIRTIIEAKVYDLQWDERY